MDIASEHKKTQNKVKGTSISRLPQGVEDSLFISYFENFYADAHAELQKSFAPESEDISALANQHIEAA